MPPNGERVPGNSVTCSFCLAKEFVLREGTSRCNLFLARVKRPNFIKPLNCPSKEALPPPRIRSQVSYRR